MGPVANFKFKLNDISTNYFQEQWSVVFTSSTDHDISPIIFPYDTWDLHLFGDKQKSMDEEVIDRLDIKDEPHYMYAFSNTVLKL